MFRTVGQECEEADIITEVKRKDKFKKEDRTRSLNATERPSTIKSNKHPLQVSGPHPQLKELVPREGNG